ncbi:MAG: hypothetical protein VW455_08690 [Nitrospinota bacterium]
MPIKITRICMWVLILSLFLRVDQAFAQAEEEEKFTTLGPIGISNKYTLPENRRTIIFRIKNYTSRSINKIFGRVFLIRKNETDPAKKFILLNNPHKGGAITKGRPHRPGTISEWSFNLIEEPIRVLQDIDYTLQVHPRSIFYVNIEPPKATEGTP